jgi:hypothetical protein
VGIKFVVAGRNAAELLQLSNQPLDEVPSSVSIMVEVRIFGLIGTMRLRRNASSSHAAEYALSAIRRWASSGACRVCRCAGRLA